MALHRYWRLEFQDPSDGINNWVMSELVMTDIPAGGNLAITAANCSASGSFPGGYVASNAIDTLTATAWVSDVPVAGVYWQYDFGGTPRDIQEITITPDGFHQTPGFARVLSSDDGIAFTPEWTIIVRFGAWLTGPRTFRKQIGHTGGHRYWRVYYADNAGHTNVQIVNLIFRATPSGADLTESGDIIAPDWYLTNRPYRAFDGLPGTQWVSGNPGTGASYLAVDFLGETPVVAEIELTASSYIPSGPTSGRVEWSADGSTWNTKFSFIPADWTAHPTQTFTDPGFTTGAATQAMILA
jgi:hypothetical protein